MQVSNWPWHYLGSHLLCKAGMKRASSCAASCRQVASAATLAAGGALEGLHRNARAQLPHECASNLEHIISQSCRWRPSCTSAMAIPCSATLRQQRSAEAPESCQSVMAHQLWMPCRESTSASDTPAPALPGPHSQTDAQLLNVLSRDSATLACMECYQVAASLCLAYPNQCMHLTSKASPHILFTPASSQTPAGADS